MDIMDIKKENKDRVRGISMYNREPFLNVEPNPRGKKQDIQTIEINATAAKDKDRFGNAKHGKKNIYVTIALLRKDESIRQKIEMLSGFDRFVYEGLCNMWIDDIEYFSIYELAQNMGYNSLSKNQYEQIKDSLIRIMSTIIYLNNKEEAEAYDYPLIDKYCSLAYLEILNMDTISNIKSENYKKWKSEHKKHNTFDGQYIVHILAIPVLLEIAIERNQITTVNIAVREIPGFYRTKFNSNIEEYVLDAVALAINAQNYRKINIINIMEILDIEKRYKDKVTATTKKIVEHYKNIHHIKDYEFNDDCFTIIPNIVKKRYKKTTNKSIVN